MNGAGLSGGVGGLPGSGEWVIAIAEESVDEAEFTSDAADDFEGQVLIVAIREPDDLGDVTEVEHRFRLVRNTDDEISAAYWGASLHRHEKADGECEIFLALEDEIRLADVPDSLRRLVEDRLDYAIHPPNETPVDAHPVTKDDLFGSDTTPRGFH